MAISGSVSTAFNLKDARAVGLIPSVPMTLNQAPAFTYIDGAGALAANVLYQGVRTLSGTTDSVDLNAVLTDSFGSTVNLVRVKAILVVNNSASNDIVVGNGTNPWATLLSATGTVTLPPGSWFAAATGGATGWTVTASTGDILKITGTSGQSYNLVVLGASS